MIKQSIYNLSCGPCGRIPRNHFVVLFLLEMKGTEKRLLHLSLLIVMGHVQDIIKGAGRSVGFGAGVVETAPHVSVYMCGGEH